jgi:hypothetical protein
LLSIKYAFHGSEIIVNIDNNFDQKLYENNLNFSNYSTQIKVIALYYPNYQNIQENTKSINISFNEWTNINQTRPLFFNHHQPRKPGDIQNYLGYYDSSSPDIILKQIELAKSHGIYGFGIYYYWFSGIKLFEKTLNIFLKNKNINFPYFIIWKNEDFKRNTDNNNVILIKQRFGKNDIDKFIKDIRKYLISQNYIKIERKPILGINNISKIPCLKNNLLILRKKAKAFGIGEIFILAKFNRINDEIAQMIDAVYEVPPNLCYKYQNIKRNICYYYYSTLFYDLKMKNKNGSIIFFKGNAIELDTSFIMYNEYSPLKFYNSNKILIQWINKYLNSTNKFFFINSWNNWLEGSYLEPDESYGYASINALSKALFNLTYKEEQYNLLELSQIPKILVILHLSFEDKNKYYDIINLINNIPVKFDLFISTYFIEAKKVLEELISKYSKANIYKIYSQKNKNKNKIFFLIQIRKNINCFRI